MLTPRGWLFFLAVLTLTAVGLGVNNATLALVGLTLVSWFLGSWLLFVLRLRLAGSALSVVREVLDERGPVDSFWAGWTFTIRARLCNDSPVTLPYARISDRVPPILSRRDGNTANDGPVARNQTLEVTYRVTCSTPGLARFDGLSVCVVDVQGFFIDNLFVRAIRTYRVLPGLADAKGHIPAVKRHNLLPLLGHHPHRRPGTGSELLDLRDYRPGDPPKTIAWKVSARRGRLMTKDYDSEVPIRCTLFVDTSHSVRVGGTGQNALARIVQIAAAAAQASAAARDLPGLCLFDEEGTRQVRPARGGRHLIQMLNHLADAAALAPTTANAPVSRLLPIAYGLAQELYPELLRPGVNAMPWWLPWWAPQPAYTIRRPALPARSWWAAPLLWLGRRLLHAYQAIDRRLAAPVSRMYRRRYRWRKQLAAMLSVRYGLAPGGLAALLEDDDLCTQYLQRFLAEHQVPCPLAYYDRRGRYLFASPAKVDVLAGAFLRAVGKGRDNELFVILADLLELGDQLGKVLAAVKVARARHHQVMIVCPWPPGVPLPPRAKKQHGPKARPEWETAGKKVLPSTLLELAHWPTVKTLMVRATTVRFHRAYFHLRSAFARLGVLVVCAPSDDPVPLILQRLERLRILEKGVR